MYWQRDQRQQSWGQFHEADKYTTLLSMHFCSVVDTGYQLHGIRPYCGECLAYKAHMPLTVRSPHLVFAVPISVDISVTKS